MKSNAKDTIAPSQISSQGHNLWLYPRSLWDTVFQISYWLLSLYENMYISVFYTYLCIIFLCANYQIHTMGYFETCRDQEGFYSEDKAFTEVQWKTTELPPLPQDRLMSRLSWEAQDAEDAWSLSSTTSRHEDVKLVHIPHAMTKTLSEYSFHTFTWKVLNASIAIWVPRRHLVACVLGASVEALAEEDLQGCPCEKRWGDAPCCTEAALRDPPGQDKIQPIRQACCAPGKTHLRMGKIWEREEEGRWREEVNRERRTESEWYNRGSRKMRCSMAEWMAVHESPRGSEIKGRSIKEKPPHADHNLHPAAHFVWLKALLNGTCGDSKAERSGVWMEAEPGKGGVCFCLSVLKFVSFFVFHTQISN